METITIREKNLICLEFLYLGRMMGDIDIHIYVCLWKFICPVFHCYSVFLTDTSSVGVLAKGSSQPMEGEP